MYTTVFNLFKLTFVANNCTPSKTLRQHQSKKCTPRPQGIWPRRKRRYVKNKITGKCSNYNSQACKSTAVAKRKSVITTQERKLCKRNKMKTEFWKCKCVLQVHNRKRNSWWREKHNLRWGLILESEASNDRRNDWRKIQHHGYLEAQSHWTVISIDRITFAF